MVPERLLAALLSFVLALVLLPVAMGITTAGWLKVGGGGVSGLIIALAVGMAIFALTLWKVRGGFRRLLDSLASRVPEPIYSCLAAGATGALLAGSVMLTLILLLGHTRPAGWEIDQIPFWMGIAFLIFLLWGLPLGMQRKRNRNP